MGWYSRLFFAYLHDISNLDVMYTELKNRIERAWEDATLLHEPEILDAIGVGKATLEGSILTVGPQTSVVLQ